MDWVSRAVLAWRLSNTLGAEYRRCSAAPKRGSHPHLVGKLDETAAILFDIGL
jgi:hypothetical protein